MDAAGREAHAVQDDQQAREPAESPTDGGVVQVPTRAKKRRIASTEATVQDTPPPDPALAAHLEAVLVSLDRPVQPARVAEALGLLPMPPAGQDEQEGESSAPSKADAARAQRQIEGLVRLLNDAYEQSGRAFRIELLAGGYRLMTLPQFAGTLSLFHKSKAQGKLSRAAVETLAIVAYKQPITRAELEAIRGVACGEVLKTLLERRLVTIRGRAEELGRPMLYGTTTQFLATFGLASIKDLPPPSELKLGS